MFFRLAAHFLDFVCGPTEGAEETFYHFGVHRVAGRLGILKIHFQADNFGLQEFNALEVGIGLIQIPPSGVCRRTGLDQTDL